MGRAARARRLATTLPEEQWWCVWCDRRPADGVTFNRREHVIAESLGGDRNFRLLRGLVCDDCNGGILQKIDEEMMLNSILRMMRAFIGVGPRFRGLAPGFDYDRETRQAQINLSKLNAGTALSFNGSSFTTSSTGPSATTMVRAEHANRGYHRMAYNALVHARGPAYAREHLGFLRELVLDLERITHRAALIDYEAVKAAFLNPTTAPAAPSQYQIHGDDRAELVELHIGPLTVFVSALQSTAPLRRIADAHPHLFVYSAIDQA